MALFLGWVVYNKEIFFAAWISQIFEVVNAKGGAHQWNVTSREMSQQYKVISSIPVDLKKSDIHTVLQHRRHGL